MSTGNILLTRIISPVPITSLVVYFFVLHTKIHYCELRLDLDNIKSYFKLSLHTFCESTFFVKGDQPPKKLQNFVHMSKP